MIEEPTPSVLVMARVAWSKGCRCRWPRRGGVAGRGRGRVDVGGARGSRRNRPRELEGDRLSGRQRREGPGVGARVERDPGGKVRAGDVGRPWVGRVSTTLTFEASEGPLLETDRVGV